MRSGRTGATYAETFVIFVMTDATRAETKGTGEEGKRGKG
jgi:hypothetical protein